MSIVGRLSRRRFLRGTGAAALGAAGGITCPRLVFAQNKKAIKFTLAWVAEGGSLFTFVAKGMGFWDKYGLDVDIARGSDRSPPHKRSAKAGSISGCRRRRSPFLADDQRVADGGARRRAHMMRRWHRRNDRRPDQDPEGSRGPKDGLGGNFRRLPVFCRYLPKRLA